MILQGKNLIISANGSVLAASKSCSLDVDVDTIKVSSPTDGEWEHSIAGRKAWKLSTSHLLEAGPKTVTVEAMAYAHNGLGITGTSFVKVNNAKVFNSQRGLTLYSIGNDYNINLERSFDTYENTDNVCEQMVDYFDNYAPDTTLVIVSYDAFGMTDNLLSAITSNLHANVANIPTGASRGAFVAIGSKTAGNGTGIALFCAEDNYTYGHSVHAQLNLSSPSTPVTFTPLRNAVKNVGQTFDISVQVDGLGSDRLTGQAICESFKTQGTLGNLLTGSYSWIGTGPLE